MKTFNHRFCIVRLCAPLYPHIRTLPLCAHTFSRTLGIDVWA